MEPQMIECRKVKGDLYISVKDRMIDMECRMDFEAEYEYSKSCQCILQDFQDILDGDIKLTIRKVFPQVYPGPFGVNDLEQLENPDISEALIRKVRLENEWNKLGVMLEQFRFTSFKMDCESAALLERMIQAQRLTNPAVQAQAMVKDVFEKKQAIAKTLAAEKKTEWICSCGNGNSRNFCTECGTKRPAVLKCSNCGWFSGSGEKMPNFCPECGTRFQERG